MPTDGILHLHHGPPCTATDEQAGESAVPLMPAASHGDAKEPGGTLCMCKHLFQKMKSPKDKLHRLLPAEEANTKSNCF